MICLPNSKSTIFCILLGIVTGIMSHCPLKRGIFKLNLYICNSYKPLKSIVMKKRFLTILGAILLISISAIAAEYHYGFITSCGVTGYKSFAYELTDAELVFWTDYFEARYCQPSMPIE